MRCDDLEDLLLYGFFCFAPLGVPRLDGRASFLWLYSKRRATCVFSPITTATCEYEVRLFVRAAMSARLQMIDMPIIAIWAAQIAYRFLEATLARPLAAFDYGTAN